MCVLGRVRLGVLLMATGIETVWLLMKAAFLLQFDSSFVAGGIAGSPSWLEWGFACVRSRAFLYVALHLLQNLLKTDFS